MGVPTSEVGYTSAIPRRDDHEVRKGHVGHWIKKKKKIANRLSQAKREGLVARYGLNVAHKVSQILRSYAH